MSSLNLDIGDDPLLGPTELMEARRYIGDMTRQTFVERYACPGLILTMGEDVANPERAGGGTTDVTVQGMHRGSETITCVALIAKKPANHLFPQMVTLGRKDSADIALDYPTVSKLHAFIYTVGSNWVIVDAGSSNGTFVNGLKLVPRDPHHLQSGERFNLGYDVTAQFLLPEDLSRYFIL